MLPIEKLKTRLNIKDNSQDTLLTQILEDSQNEILDYCNRDIILPKMEALQRELAVIYYNRQGSEGEASRSEGAVSVSYITDIPQNIKARLNSYRLLKGARMKYANKK